MKDRGLEQEGEGICVGVSGRHADEVLETGQIRAEVEETEAINAGYWEGMLEETRRELTEQRRAAAGKKKASKRRRKKRRRGSKTSARCVWMPVMGMMPRTPLAPLSCVAICITSIAWAFGWRGA
jgi:hypothetical protein